MPFQIAIFVAKNAVRSETNFAPTKNIAAKATTCLRRGRVRIKCMSMSKCRIHCTPLYQKIVLAQEVPYPSRICSASSESTANKWHAVVPYSSLFEKLGAFRKHIVSPDQCIKICSISIVMRSHNAMHLSKYGVSFARYYSVEILRSFQKFNIPCKGAASRLRAYVYNAAFLQRGICILFRTYSSIIMRSIPLVQCTYTHIRQKEKERERDIYIYT